MTLRPSYSGSNNLLPIGLLLACRQTYTEASTTLFSQNALCLDYDDAQHTRECHLEMLFRNVRLLLFEGRLFNRSFDKRGLKAVERLEVVVQYWSDESMEEKKRRDGEALRRHFGGKKVVFMPRVQGAA